MKWIPEYFIILDVATYETVQWAKSILGTFEVFYGEKYEL